MKRTMNDHRIWSARAIVVPLLASALAACGENDLSSDATSRPMVCAAPSGVTPHLLGRGRAASDFDAERCGDQSSRAMWIRSGSRRRKPAHTSSQLVWLAAKSLNATRANQ